MDCHLLGHGLQACGRTASVCVAQTGTSCVGLMWSGAQEDTTLQLLAGLPSDIFQVMQLPDVLFYFEMGFGRFCMFACGAHNSLWAPAFRESEPGLGHRHEQRSHRAGLCQGQGDYQDEMLSSLPSPDFMKLNSCKSSCKQSSFSLC